MLNLSKGNMYPFIDYTWNPISGRCSHNCMYCFAKRTHSQKLHVNQKTLNDNLKFGNFIFVGSSTDMWADDVPMDWIVQVLAKCKVNYNNKYLFQTKNPKRFKDFLYCFPQDTVLGITLETNRSIDISNAPRPVDRIAPFLGLNLISSKKIISIEPIMNFDLDILINWLKNIDPLFITIGADSQGHHLQEPSPEKVEELITELQKFTRVILKENLKRLIGL